MTDTDKPPLGSLRMKNETLFVPLARSDAHIRSGIYRGNEIKDQ
jgi:hypothetical protein